MSENNREADKHWLYRRENRTTLWTAQFAILALALVPEFFVDRHAHFDSLHIDASWGFYAWFGFVSCALMVVVAKLLGFLLKRKDTYYDD